MSKYFYEVVIYKDIPADKNKCTFTFKYEANAIILCEYVERGFKMSDNPSSTEKEIVKQFEARCHNHRLKYKMTKAVVFHFMYFESLMN